MRTIHVTHRHEPAFGWSFDSPDIPGLIGGPASTADFAEARRHAESAVRFHLECEAEERGEPIPENLTIEHLLPAAASARAS
jgi:predicted RNase H-like HicB family nuclease